MPNPTLPFPHSPDYSPEAWLPTAGTQQATQYLSNLAPTRASANAPTVILVGPPATGKTHLLNIWHTQKGPFAPVQDDLQDLDRVGQEKLFHDFNTNKNLGVTMLIASRLHPTELQGFLPDLISRLTTSIVLELTPPTDAERKQLLLKWLSERQLNLAPPVQDYLLTHASRNVGELHSLLAHLDDLSLGQGRPITIPLIRPLLQPGLPL